MRVSEKSILIKINLDIMNKNNFQNDNDNVLNHLELTKGSLFSIICESKDTQFKLHLLSKLNLSSTENLETNLDNKLDLYLNNLNVKNSTKTIVTRSQSNQINKQSDESDYSEMKNIKEEIHFKLEKNDDLFDDESRLKDIFNNYSKSSDFHDEFN
jgi:hypothetical protein